MRLTTERYAPLAFLIGLALLIGLSMISYRSLNDLTQTADQVTDTHLVMSKLEEVLSDIKDVMSGYRVMFLPERILISTFTMRAGEASILNSRNCAT